MIFGEKFYPSLRRMTPWRQSLFALTLAQRQFPNYIFNASFHEDRGVSEFNYCLKKLWEFHQEKFNHIDLEETLNVYLPFAPALEQEDFNQGELYALDASLSLIAAYDAIVMHEGNEAEIASRSSISSVIRVVESYAEDEGHELTEDEIREVEIVDNEVNFQVSLFELLKSAKREKDLVHNLIKIALKEDVSNIGIDIVNKGDINYKNYAK